MTPHTPEDFSTTSIDWKLFAITGGSMPPRDPDEDEDDEDDDGPPVVREPDED